MCLVYPRERPARLLICIHVHNNPVSFTDPSGHCAEPISGTICIGAGTVIIVGGAIVIVGIVTYDLLSSDFNLISDVGEAASELLTEANIFFAKKSEPKTLTDDEKDQIGKIDQIPDFLEDHPDIAEEADRQKEGWVPGKREDHVEEARQRIQSIDNAIDVLERVRHNRTPEAQQEIDDAIARGQTYRKQLEDLIGD